MKTFIGKSVIFTYDDGSKTRHNVDGLTEKEVKSYVGGVIIDDKDKEITIVSYEIVPHTY